MKLDVPFYPQTNETNCGPAALQMVLSYFGDLKELKEIEKAASIEQGKGLYTIQLANAAARFGYDVRFFTTSLGFNASHFEMDFYKNYASMDETRSAALVQESKRAGVVSEARSVRLKELLSFITKDSLAIILLDWSIVAHTGKGYQGHFVPIVGYDGTFVYVHNQGAHMPQPFLAIPYEVFEKARKARGTDEDLLVIAH